MWRRLAKNSASLSLGQVTVSDTNIASQTSRWPQCDLTGISLQGPPLKACLFARRPAQARQTAKRSPSVARRPGHGASRTCSAPSLLPATTSGAVLRVCARVLSLPIGCQSSNASDTTIHPNFPGHDLMCAHIQQLRLSFRHETRKERRLRLRIFADLYGGNAHWSAFHSRRSRSQSSQ